MSLMKEYIERRLGIPELENELQQLIKRYNQKRNTYMFVYVAAIGKPIPGVELVQDDYYIINDMLSGKNGASFEMYIETPGGSGETAEEIVESLHSKFELVSYVVSAEAKSAGTIIVLSGDEILMTETGSLGPIDAQIRIGRSVTSAYDYMEWVESKREEAVKAGALNPFDAIMVAQITPGELGGVNHSLKFAQDLVVKWLVQYKFKNWKVTETRKVPVTEEMKKQRAADIAAELTNHSKWRSHGRSLKIEDLERIGLKITGVDTDKELADIVYRIQTVCRLIIQSTTTYKIFATEDNKIFRQAAQQAPMKLIEPQEADVVNIEQRCEKCGELYKLYLKLKDKPQIDADMQKQGFTSFPKDAKILCKCGFEINLAGIKNEIEGKLGRKLI